MTAPIVAACPCLEHGPRAPYIADRRSIGCDETEGRFADVTLARCTRCQQLWIRYQVDYEAFSRSGRWCEAVISPEDAGRMTPEAVPAYLAAAPWHIFGGSAFGHGGRHGRGPVQWGLV